jgi:SAM-dependent methyltransferase
MKENKNLVNDYEKYFLSEDWDDPIRWDKFYSEMANDHLIRERDPRYLIRTIEKLKFPTPVKILDAGTGISTLANLAAHMGHHVLAVDVSPVGIEICRQRIVLENDLSKCLGHQYNWRYQDGRFDYIDQKTNQPVDVYKELKDRYKPGGKIIAFETCNWNDPGLIEKYGGFDIVLNQNGLRNASYDLIEKSFRSFYNLLRPGGVVIETNTNAIDRIKTINKYALNAGFILLEEMQIVYDQVQFYPEIKQNEKYALCCWPTG